MNPRPSENEDPFSLYFDNLCTMADQLKEDLAELNTRRDICQRCEYDLFEKFLLKYTKLLNRIK